MFYNKNLRLFQCCCNQLNVTLHADKTSDRPRKGKPRMTMPHKNRNLGSLHLQNCFLAMASSVTNVLSRGVSRQTVAM